MVLTNFSHPYFMISAKYYNKYIYPMLAKKFNQVSHLQYVSSRCFLIIIFLKYKYIRCFRVVYFRCYILQYMLSYHILLNSVFLAKLLNSVNKFEITDWCCIIPQYHKRPYSEVLKHIYKFKYIYFINQITILLLIRKSNICTHIYKFKYTISLEPNRYKNEFEI